MTDPRPHSLTLRVRAVIPIVLFIPSLVSFAIAEPGVAWPEYSGILFHLAFLLIIARLDAPEWARAAGYGWIVLDVLTGILTINELPYDLTWPVRMGGHVLAGVWLITASVYAPRLPVKIVGILAGIFLGGYSFVGNFAPLELIYPSSVLLIAWLLLIAAMHRSLETEGAPTAHRPLQ